MRSSNSRGRLTKRSGKSDAINGTRIAREWYQKAAVAGYAQANQAIRRSPACPQSGAFFPKILGEKTNKYIRTKARLEITGLI